MDQEWVLDSLIGFLRGPLWSEPVFTFLDERSVVFDVDDTPENQHEYLKVYNSYKELVNQLLDSHMKELSITPKQFEQAVQDANDFLSQRLQQTLFEQIWAADHFDSFKRMMIQVNIDLQLWALEILAAKYGMIPSLFLPEGSSLQDFVCDDETSDDWYISSKLRSLVDFAGANEKDREEKSIDCPSHTPCRQEEVASVALPRAKDQENRRNSRSEQAMMEKTLPPIKQKKDEGEKSIRITSPSDDDDSRVQEALTGLLNVEIERPKTAAFRQFEVKTIRSKLGQSDKEELDEEEIRKRQTYLRSQRDRLLKLKKEEREQQVKRMQELQQSGRRPPTAKFIALEKEKQSQDDNETDDRSGAGGGGGGGGGSGGGGGDRALAYIRSLAARIKSEVSEAEVEKKS